MANDVQHPTVLLLENDGGTVERNDYGQIDRDQYSGWEWWVEVTAQTVGTELTLVIEKLSEDETTYLELKTFELTTQGGASWIEWPPGSHLAVSISSTTGWSGINVRAYLRPRR